MDRTRDRSNARARDLLRSTVIGDGDLLEVLQMWRFKPNRTRKNVVPKGSSFVFSETFGLVRSRDGKILTTNITRQYDSVFTLLCKWLNENSPTEFKYEFPFTFINVNYDYGARIHRDGNNLGPSMTKSFGHFSGGELLYWGEDDGSSPLERLRRDDAQAINSHSGLLLFDGRRAHAVAPFEGDRYSLVYFTVPKYARVLHADREMLMRCKVVWPSEKAARYFASLLGPPKGYSAGFRAQSILKYMGRADPSSAMHWKSVCLAALGATVLKHVLTFAVFPATILGRTDVALRDLLLVRVCPTRVCEDVL